MRASPRFCYNDGRFAIPMLAYSQVRSQLSYNCSGTRFSLFCLRKSALPCPVLSQVSYFSTVPETSRLASRNLPVEPVSIIPDCRTRPLHAFYAALIKIGLKENCLESSGARGGNDSENQIMSSGNGSFSRSLTSEDPSLRESLAHMIRRLTPMLRCARTCCRKR